MHIYKLRQEVSKTYVCHILNLFIMSMSIWIWLKDINRIMDYYNYDAENCIRYHFVNTTIVYNFTYSNDYFLFLILILYRF